MTGIPRDDLFIVVGRDDVGYMYPGASELSAMFVKTSDALPKYEID